MTEEAFTIRIVCQDGRFDEVPVTMPERCYQLIETAFAELFDEGVIDMTVTLPGTPSTPERGDGHEQGK